MKNLVLTTLRLLATLFVLGALFGCWTSIALATDEPRALWLVGGAIAETLSAAVAVRLLWLIWRPLNARRGGAREPFPLVVQSRSATAGAGRSRA